MSKSIVGGVRKLDDLGRVVIPSEIRKELNLNIGEQLIVEVKEGKIIISPLEKVCRCCGSKATVTILDISLCKKCASIHKKQLNLLTEV